MAEEPFQRTDDVDAHPGREARIVTFEEIEAARRRIQSAIALTPCTQSKLLSEQLGCKVFLKFENLQLTGSFKERGACNKLMLLSDEERECGVIASSAGNHAQAIAYHGSRLGISTKIVMPEGTPLVKVSRTRRFGAEVVLHGANYDESYAHAMQLASEEGRTFAHPFDDVDVIAGQGTIGLELLEQNPYLDVVLLAIGGGGLASGVAVALKEVNPKIRVVGVEPEVLPSMKTALERGQDVELPEATTLADGIAVRRVGTHTRATVERYVDEVVTVSEESIANAILTLMEQDKTIAEGAGAAAVAALINGSVEGVAGKRVCPVICGGNIDVNIISRIIERGLVAAGRLLRLELVVTDTPGTLGTILTLLGELRANVLGINHNRMFTSGSTFGSVDVELLLETRGPEHIDEIRRAVVERGYELVE